MSDPWGSFQNFMNGFRQFASNPAQYMMQRGMPQKIANNPNPNAIIQQMMNSGKLKQEDYNAVRQAASRIQNNPLFNQLMGRK